MARLEVFELRHRFEIDERVDEILVTGQNKSMLGGGRREEGGEGRERGEEAWYSPVRSIRRNVRSR